MQADLYNLQPAIGEVNGLRSNYQIAIIKGESRKFGKCNIEIKSRLIKIVGCQVDWVLEPEV